MPWWNHRVNPTTIARIVEDMRLIAEADARLHERELSLIAAFEQSIPEDTVVPEDLQLDEPHLQQAYLRALLMLAWVDGELSEHEYDLVRDLARDRGIDTTVVLDVAESVRKAFVMEARPQLNFRGSLDEVARALGQAEDHSDTWH